MAQYHHLYSNGSSSHHIRMGPHLSITPTSSLHPHRKEAVAVMRTTARPTIARDRLSSQSRTVTIRLVRLKDYLGQCLPPGPSANAHRNGNNDHPWSS
ncbi:hypothetical protein TYRP_022191 [Tyrophagus putrescentiae]|nr:hypothetical protein TYRP_022191 [Tyrophagus putrescentiae]